MPIAAFVPAIIGGATSVIGGIMGSKSAKNAGNTVQAAGNDAAKRVTDATTTAQAGVTDATNSAQNIMKQAYGDTRAAYSPYAQAGQTGIEGLLEALKPGGSLSKQFEAPTADEAAATPGYQFQNAEGQKAALRAASAGGNIASGGTLKALNQYSQGLASTYYQNAYNNALKTFQTNHDNTANGLMSLTNLGQFGASGIANASQNYGTTSAQNLMQGAFENANLGLAGTESANRFMFEGAGGKAAGDVGSTNSWLNALKGIGQAGSNAATTYNGQQKQKIPGITLNGSQIAAPRSGDMLDENGDWLN